MGCTIAMGASAMRHVDAGYGIARVCAREQKLELPMAVSCKKRFFRSRRAIVKKKESLQTRIKSELRKTKTHLLGITLWALFVASVVLMFKASEEPVIRSLRGTWIERSLHQFASGNRIIFEVSIGLITGLIIYVLVVWLPDETDFVMDRLSRF